MLDLNDKSVPVEYRELTPVESVPLPEGFQSKASMVNESGTLRIYLYENDEVRYLTESKFS